jgi:GxxExxY protein
MNYEKLTTKDTKNTNERIIFKEESYAIHGAVFEVYREMGCGFLEPVYQECLEKEFAKRAIPFTAQKELRLMYKDEQLQQTYKPDFICHNKIIVELKAVKSIAPEHEAQVLNYLKATGMKLALLVNFGAYPKATVKRFVL